MLPGKETNLPFNLFPLYVFKFFSSGRAAPALDPIPERQGGEEPQCSAFLWPSCWHAGTRPPSSGWSPGGEPAAGACSCSPRATELPAGSPGLQPLLVTTQGSVQLPTMQAVSVLFKLIFLYLNGSSLKLADLG